MFMDIDFKLVSLLNKLLCSKLQVKHSWIVINSPCRMHILLYPPTNSYNIIPLLHICQLQTNTLWGNTFSCLLYITSLESTVGPLMMRTQVQYSANKSETRL